MTPQKLNAEEITQHLLKLEGWTIDDTQKCIKKTFAFNDFIAAFGFVTQVAMCAEKLNHHPTWSNTYNKVSIELSTHDVGGISVLDFKLAGQIDKL